MDYRQLEQIDNYHSGRMTSEEVTSFENMLSSDPTLKAESDLQGEIIEGLKLHRKNALKSRLDAVDVTPSWIEFVQQSTLLKSFGGVAVATLIGTGIYFSAVPVTEISTDKEIIVDAPKFDDPEFIWELGGDKKNEVAVLEPLTKKLEKTEELDKIPSEGTPSKAEEAMEKTKAEAFAPDFSAPNAKSVEDEEALKTTVLDELPNKSAAKANEGPIDVKTEITKSLDIKYKYYDGKLFLSGDFDRAPYEILEINSASGRRIYVKYLDKYYQVGTTDRLTELPEVTDLATIAELNLLRQNK